MARLRFPGRPGYRFDRIGVRFSADEARQTTDPTLAIVASIHKGLQRFRKIFGDSDEEDTEFVGFTPAEVRAAERNFQHAVRQEKQLLEQQAQKHKYRYERSKATLTSLAASGIEFSKQTRSTPVNLRKTYKKIVNTRLVVDSSDKLKIKNQNPAPEVASITVKQNGPPVSVGVSDVKRIRLKRLTQNADATPGFRRPVGRPRKFNAFLDGASDYQKATSFESIAAASSVFGTKPVSKYTSVAKQILARATKQAVQTSSKLLTSKHKVRKFVLPTKSSRSSRVIKPNKRFLEDDNVHQLVAKHPKLSPTSPTSISAFKTPLFGMGVGSDKSNSFSAFQSRGLSLSPFNMNREKGFPAFSAAPQPSGTSSFMDQLTSQKPLGSLDQPLIVEGKRPRKPSLIMRMKLVEDDPADEIRLQQQLSDVSTPAKPSPISDGQKSTTDSKSSLPTLPSQTKCFGATKSLIAPAKLFTDSSTMSLSSKSFKSHHKHQQNAPSTPSQSTIVLRQAKLQLNRTALNRSKAALARSLKAQLKREAKLERRKRTTQNRLGRLPVSAPSAVSPRSSLSQLSPFSKLASDSAIERQKSGLFEGIEAGAGSFSPGSFGSPPVTPSSLSVPKPEVEKSESYQASLITTESLLKEYVPGSKWRCLVCGNLCIIKKNRKLPQVPLCKSCKKSYFFQLITKSGSASRRRCKCGGRCSIHFSQKSQHHCVQCKFRKFEAIINKCRQLGVDTYKVPKDDKKEVLVLQQQQQQRSRNRSGDSGIAETKDLVKIKKHADGFAEVKQEEPFSPIKKQRHKSEEMITPDGRRNKHKRGESDTITPTRQRQKHRSGDKLPELASLKLPAKSPSHNKELINAANLDKPLSVDVGEDTDPFSLSPPQTLSSTKSSPDKSLRSPSKKFTVTSNGSDKLLENDDDNDDDSEAVRSRGTSRGPRIKHVCRRAAMVFPQQRATFPEEPQKRTLTLSALPNEEKQQLWAKSKQEMAEDSSADESGDEKPLSKMSLAASPDKKLLSPKDEKLMDIKKERRVWPQLDRKLAMSREERMDDTREGKLVRNRTASEEKTMATLPNKVKRKSMAQEKEKLRLAAKRRGYTRKIRCRECKGCKTPECGVCVFCRDKPKFGGPGKIKKCCIHSVCLAPKIPRKATQAFIEPKSPTKTNRRDDDDQNGDHHTRNQNSGAGFRESSSRYQEKRANSHWRMDGSGDGAQDSEGGVNHGGGSSEDMDASYLISGTSASSIQNGLDMDGSRLYTGVGSYKAMRCARGKCSQAVEATIQLALTDVRNPFMGRLGHFRRKDKISVPQKQSSVELKPVQNETAYSFDVPLKTHLIRADYEDDYDIETAWSHGFSLTVTGPSCIRTLCFLCGSAGKHEMLYCIVCCQPYHSFCLDEDERPEYSGNEEEGDDGSDDHHHGGSNSSTISWCCRRCQFCHVCGQQNGLLKCHRCKDTYHPECLGPNYPTRPSRKNIWVCTKCVRCKSCGATTPGVGTNATWTYDFSLCYECGKLMDKGNFCPICHKCYSDDDWESKMVQCAVCESWVHAKCEELTDEMYQLVSFLPEEVQYTCRVCSTDSPPYWERVLKSELVNGLLNVLSSLMSSKCAQLLLESGPPKDNKKPKNSKGKIQDGTRFNMDDSSSSETTPCKDFSSSTDSTDSIDTSGFDTFVFDAGQGTDEQCAIGSGKTSEQNSIPCSTDISHRTKQVLTRCDKEIVEKCDCDTVQIQSCNQRTALNGHSFGRSQLLSKFPEVNSDSILGASSSEKPEEGHCQRQIADASVADLNMVLKGDIRKALGSAAPGAATNGECGMKNSTNDSDVMDLLLGLVSKDINGGIFDNPKVSSNASKSTRFPGDIIPTEQNKCDTSKYLNSEIGLSPLGRPSSASSISDLPSSSFQLNSTSSETQKTDNSSKSSSLASGPSAILPSVFYSNTNKESVVKNLFPNHHSSAEPIQSSGRELVPGTGSKCALSDNSEDHVSLPGVSANNTESSFSDNLRSNIEGDTRNTAGSDLQLHQAISSATTSFVPASSLFSSLTTTAVIPFQQDMGEPKNAKGQLEQTPVKKLIGFPSPASGLHVSFGHTVQENLHQNSDFPQDFHSIKLKIDSGSYTTVEEFSEDMVRIIQSLLFENEQYTTRKKQANSVRSIFIKQMERCFPWFNVNTCKLWEHNRRLPPGMLKDAVLPPSGDHTYAQWLERKTSPMSPQPSPFKRVGTMQRHISNDGDSSELCRTAESQHHLVQTEDTRACLLCQKLGDDEPDCAGRLLYCGQDDWIHVNCALWSAEVFEEDDGSVQNVQDALSRGKKLRCNMCQQTGATVGCCETNCRANYHFMCARADQCVFQENKTIYCKLHASCVNMNVVKDGQFDIASRICVNLSKIRAKSSWGKAVDPATLNIIIGSCTVESLGVLQSFLSDTEEALFPVDFRCTRIYWSTQDARRRCVYTCRIVEVKPETDSPGLQIQDMRVVHDENHPDYVTLDQLNLESLGIPNFMKQNSKSCGQVGEVCDDVDDVVYMGSSEPMSATMAPSHGLHSVSSSSCTQMSSNTVTVSHSSGNIISQPFSFQTTQNQISFSADPEHCFIVDEDDPHGVAKTWPVKVQKEKPKAPEPKPIDLSGLSPSTLALLNIKDPHRYIPPTPRSEVERHSKNTTLGTKSSATEELGLVKIADRLNNAASGRSRHSSTDTDRDILRSPPLQVHGSLQHHNRLRMQEVSKSLSSSPVSFRHVIRERSSSEERFESFVPSFTSPRRSLHLPNCSSPVLSRDRFRARSESPFTVIKHQDTNPLRLRAMSLSPPPITVHKAISASFSSFTSLLPSSDQQVSTELDEEGSCKERMPKSGSVTPIIEVSEDDEAMIIEDAKKKSSLDTCYQFENLDRMRRRIRRPRSSTPEKGDRGYPVEDKFDYSEHTFGNTDVSTEMSSDDLSAENIRSILESVPPEVLEGEDVKVVVLTDTEDLSEEDIVQLASAAIQESSVDQEGSSHGVLEATEVCDGKEQENEGQQGEETSHGGADSDQGNTSIDGDQDSPEGSGGNAAGDVEGVGGGDCAQSASGENNSFSAGHVSCCHPGSSDLSTMSSAGIGREDTQGSGDDDDLRKPHKDEENRKKKDSDFLGVNTNVENDSEAMDTSIEENPDLVGNAEISFQSCAQDSKAISELGGDGSSVHLKERRHTGHLVSKKGEAITRHVQLPDSGEDCVNLTSDSIRKSCCSAEQTLNERFVSHGYVEDLITSDIDCNLDATLERSSCDGQETNKLTGKNCEKPQSSIESNKVHRDPLMDSTTHALDVSSFEAADHSNVGVLTEKAKKIDSLEGKSCRVRIGASKTADVRSLEFIKDGDVAVPDVAKSSSRSTERTSEDYAGGTAPTSSYIPKNLNDDTFQQSNSTISLSLAGVRVSSVLRSDKGVLRSEQSGAKMAPGFIVSTQDATTDEESDFLMLDDFSYSETNDEDDCDGGKSMIARNELPVPEQPKTDLHQAGILPEKHPGPHNTQCGKNDEVSSQKASNAACLHQAVSALATEEKLVGSSDSRKVSEPSHLLQEQEPTPGKSADTEEVSEQSECAEFLSSRNCADAENEQSESKATESKYRPGESELQLKPCFVSLRREDIAEYHLNKSSTGTGHAGPSELKHLKLRLRKISSQQHEAFFTSGSDIPSETHHQIGVENEIEDLNRDDSSEKDINCLGKDEREKVLNNNCEQIINCTSSELQSQENNGEHEHTVERSKIYENSEEEEKEDRRSGKELESEKPGELPDRTNTFKGRREGREVAEVKNAILASDVKNPGIDCLDCDAASEGKKKSCHIHLKACSDLPESLNVRDVSSHIVDVSKEEDSTTGRMDFIKEKHSLPGGYRSEDVHGEGWTVSPVDSKKDGLVAGSNERCQSDIKTKVSSEIRGINVCDELERDNVQEKGQSSQAVNSIEEIQDDHKIAWPDKRDDDNDDHINEVKCLKRKEKKQKQNISSGKVESGYEGIPSDHSGQGIDAEAISKDLYSPKESEYNQEDARSMSRSKGHAKMLEIGSEEDEKELIQIDHRVCALAQSARTTKGGDKHSSSSIALLGRRESLGSGSDDNLRERIVEKIKAESLARSSPGEEGPFKCPTCKRMYRTRESYEFHIRDCDFEVSTSDEEDKPVLKELRSNKRYIAANEEQKRRASSDVEKLKILSSSSPSPLNEPLSIIITDEFKDEKLSPSSRDLSDDCSSVQSQDSRRSSLRKSTVTQRNAAPAHLAKVRHRDSKLSTSPDGSTCSSLLSPKSSTSRMEDKPSPKETMLEAVGLVSRKSLELSPNSDLDGAGSAANQTKTVRLQPRVSPTAMSVAPKREKRSPALAGAGGMVRPSIMAGGVPKPGSSQLKSIAITYDPVIVEEIKLEPLKPKRPRQRRIWWVEASECPADNDEDKVDIGGCEDEDEDGDEEEGIARRTRQRASLELKSPNSKKSSQTKEGKRSSESNSHGDENEQNSEADRLIPKASSRPKETESKKDKVTDIFPQLPKLRSSSRLSLSKDDTKDKSEAEGAKEVTKPDIDFTEENSVAGKENHEVIDPVTEINSAHEIDLRENLTFPADNIRFTRSKDRKVKETEDEDNEEFLSEDPVSSIRRSRRHPSKTTKLSEYLTELKKEKEATVVKEEMKAEPETSALSVSNDGESRPTEISLKRGRGRPRIYSEKERPNTTEKRRGSPRQHAHSEVENEVEKLSKSEGNELDLMKNESKKLVVGRAQDESLVNSEIDSKCKTMLRSSDRLRDRSSGCAAREHSERDKNNTNATKIETSSKNTDKPLQRPMHDVHDESDISVNDQTDHLNLNSKEANISDNEPRIRTRSSSIVRQNQKDESGAAHRMNHDLNAGPDSAVQSESSVKESTVAVSDTENTHTSGMEGNSEKSSRSTDGSSQETSETPSSFTSDIPGEFVKKDDGTNLGPPFPKQAPDKAKSVGQKLRIIIRSPNVFAAQTIEELIKKTAMSVNPENMDITVTTKDTSVSQERGTTAENCTTETISSFDSEKRAKSSSSSLRDGACNLPSLDTLESAEDTKSKDETPLVSRSVSPDSVSAAYDIQSDDFSSETSNDADDYAPCVTSSVDDSLQQVTHSSVTAVAQVLQSTNILSTNVRNCGQKSNVSNHNVDDEDDDVVIVKAVGLQTPEQGLVQKATQPAYPLIGHSVPKMPISSVHSHHYSSTPIFKTNSSSTTSVSSCGRMQSTPTVLQQSGALSQLPAQPLTVSPTRQSMHPFMPLHHQNSPPQTQQPVMISEVSPGRFILQQQPNPRQEFLTSHDISQPGLLLQSAGQPGIIIQTTNQSGIALQNTTPSGILFRPTNPAGLMLPPSNPATILQGQPPILQGTGQSGLSFISLNPSNPLTSTIISPLQPLQSHVSPPSLLPSGMGLAPLMQAATLGNQHLMISQPFIGQPGVFLPQLSTQPLVTQHTEDHRQQQTQHHTSQQQQNPQQQQQQQQISSGKTSSVIIDPHAHMLTSGLNQSVLKANQQQFSPLKQRPTSTGNNFVQETTPSQLPMPPYSIIHSQTSSSPSIFSPPAVSSIPATMPQRTYSSTTTLAPVLNLQKTNVSAPKLTKVDGAPAQVNYMGSFDLNSSTLQSVMSGQSFSQEASKRIMELVQSALKNQGKEQIPGVEVTSAITNTPQGPKKVLRVFINEDILPGSKSSTSTMSSSDLANFGTSASSSTSQTLSAQVSSTTGTESEWTKLLPSSSQVSKSHLQQPVQNLWSPSNTGYVSIPVNQNLSAANRSSSQTHGSSLSASHFRRALKPTAYSHSIKRKLAPSPSSTSSEGSEAKRPIFEKMLKSDGIFTGTLQRIVERHAYTADFPSSGLDTKNLPGCNVSLGLSKPVESDYGVRPVLSAGQTMPSISLTHSTSQEGAAGGDCSHLPTTVTDEATSAFTSQENTHSQHFAHHLQQHTYHQIAKQQQLQQLQQSPHKRASFPLISPTKKPQPAVALSQAVRGRVRKQVLQKSLLKKDTLLQTRDKEARHQVSEKRKGAVRSGRIKTAVIASHHPLIHHKKGVDSLPQPTLEEEVVATPLDVGRGDHSHVPGARSERERSQSRLRFEINSDDGFSCQGDTVEDAWNQVLERVQDVRAASRMKQLSYAGISGRTMFGLDHDAVVYLIEQLYGAVHCHRNYKFRFHKYDLDQADEEVALNPSGSARSESFIARKPFDMFNFLKSVYRTKPGDDERDKEEEMALKSSRRATSLSLPMAMRFRKLKTFAKEAVDVYRSKIHGRGLFCKRNIDAGEMVIEYAGEVIRASLTDKREKYYEGKGIGCYMFRIDDDEVVDATMHGSAARFINHSCEPNCFSKVILVDGKKHIVIFAMRPIKRGEELTYDYKFPIEEVKIPCSCGSKKCRKYLN